MLRILGLWTAISVSIVAVNVASAQSYPSRVIRIVVGGTGNSLDITARIIAKGISGPLGQSVVVDNRANGIVAAEVVAKAPPDGYTLFETASPLWVFPILYPKPATYDPVRDFSTLTTTTVSPTLLVVHPSLPVKSVRDLIALAKARPGQLNAGSGTPGSINQLTVDLFRAKAGINIVQVGYKSSALGLNDLIAGNVQFMFPTTGSVAPHLKSGRLRALAVTSAERSELTPGIPTVAESGLPGFESVSVTGMFAPAKLPEAITARLNQEIVKVLNQPDVKEIFLNTGVEPRTSTPDQLARTMTTEMATVSKLVKEMGLRDK